ncbi:MAG: hypothetical protein CMF74_15965, partial [Maricaulis sp.]|nr:hypothetical protein [Maricaulis sp.]
DVSGETTITESIKKIVSPDTTLSEKGGEALDLLKRGGKAIFTKKDAQGNDVLDKTVLLGTLGFTTSYIEAKKLANDLGVDITEAEYDEARKAEKQEQYANDLQNFFAGKKDGGRIGFENGGIDMIALEKEVLKYPEMVNEITDIEPGVGIPGEPVSPESTIFMRFDKEKEEADMLQEILRELEADGGRIGLMSGSGSKKKYSKGIESAVKQIDPLQGGLDELKMGGGIPMAFTRLEKSFLFKNLAKLGGADRSFTMPQLYRILSNPGRYPKDSAALKAFLKIKGFSKGGDVGSVNEIPVRTNKAGVKELDMRSTGGFVPIGVKEKADDVPAMLSKNEFVLTADAVRGIGGGSVEKGSEKLYNLMKTAEQVGKA